MGEESYLHKRNRRGDFLPLLLIHIIYRITALSLKITKYDYWGWGGGINKISDV